MADGLDGLMLNIRKELEIGARPEIVWESLLAQWGPDAAMVDGKAYNFKLEAWPGGRLFRDLGNNTGHLWGHVQVIKPPTLLEIVGPMFMSHAVASHMQYRLTPSEKGTTLVMTHTAIGNILPEQRQGMNQGGQMILEHVKQLAERKK